MENNKVVISREEYNSLLNLKEENGRLQKQIKILIKENEKTKKEIKKIY